MAQTVKIPPAMQEIPGLGRSPREGNGLTPIFLSGKFHGQRSLADYSPWGRKESDINNRLIFSLSFTFHEH